MHEIPPEDEKPKKNGFSSNPRSAPKPDPKPKPKPKPDPKPRHTPERERRQVKLAQNVRSHTPSEPAKKSNKDGCCVCIAVVVLIALALAFFF
jgi:protein TonB